MLPQAAQRLDTRRELWPDEVRIRVERLNLDAAQLPPAGDQARRRRRRPSGPRCWRSSRSRGKMQNPVTGSGGMLIGTVDEVGPDVAARPAAGDRVATLVSLTLTPLAITDGLADWDGRGEQVPGDGHAILFARSIAAVLPDDLDPELALAVLDVCGAPALTDRVVAAAYVATAHESVAVIGGAGKSGSLSLAAARRAGARTVGVVPHRARARPARARPAWPTTSRWPTPGTRWRWPTP